MFPSEEGDPADYISHFSPRPAKGLQCESWHCKWQYLRISKMHHVVIWALLDGVTRGLLLLKQYFFVLRSLNMIIFWESPGSRKQPDLSLTSPGSLDLYTGHTCAMWRKQLQQEGWKSCACGDRLDTREVLWESGNGVPHPHGWWMSVVTESTARPPHLNWLSKCCQIPMCLEPCLGRIKGRPQALPAMEFVSPSWYELSNLI